MLRITALGNGDYKGYTVTLDLEKNQDAGTLSELFIVAVPLIFLLYFCSIHV